MGTSQPSNSMAQTAKLSAQQITAVVLLIPFGKVASYGQIADLAGLPGRARLVGKVLKEADSQLGLPWFRVIRAGGRLAFDEGTDKAIEQQALLLKESVKVKNNRVDIDTFGWRPTLGELLVMQY